MAAEVIAAAGAAVTVFEQMPSVGRKLILAGRGGLNITHSEGFDHFLARYGNRRAQLSFISTSRSSTYCVLISEEDGQCG